MFHGASFLVLRYVRRQACELKMGNIYDTTLQTLFIFCHVCTNVFSRFYFFLFGRFYVYVV